MERGRRRGSSLTKSLFVKLKKLPDAYSRRRQVPPNSWVANSWELPTRKNVAFLKTECAHSRPIRCRFQPFSARVHKPQHLRPLPRSCDLTSRDPRVCCTAAPFDARTKNFSAHPSVWQPAARVTDPSGQEGIAIPDHNKINNIRNPVCDGWDDLFVCILKLNNWEILLYYGVCTREG